MNPITGIACCARAASGHAAAPPSSVMKSRRFTARCLPCFRVKGIARLVLLHCGIFDPSMTALVIHDPGGRSHTAVHVRFAPKPDIILGSLPPPTLGECRHRGSPTRLLPTCL